MVENEPELTSHYCRDKLVPCQKSTIAFTSVCEFSKLENTQLVLLSKIRKVMKTELFCKVLEIAGHLRSESTARNSATGGVTQNKMAQSRGRSRVEKNIEQIGHEYHV